MGQRSRWRPRWALGERGALSVGVSWLVAAATAGAGVGLGLGVSGVDLARGVRVLTTDAVAYFDCPDGTALGDLHRGDRAYATARNESGEWLEVRSPEGPGGRVWIAATYAIPDDSTDGLPVVDCDAELLAAPGAIEIPEPGETSAPGLPGVPAPTSPDGSEPGPGGGGPGSDGGGAGGGPAAPSDTTPPMIGGPIQAFPSSINEVGPPGDLSCPNNVKEATVSVSGVSDPGGIASVMISWSVGSQSGSKAMSPGAPGSYSTKVGNFPSTTLAGGSAPVTLTVTARDQAGNQSTKTGGGGVLTLHNCGTA